MKNNKKPVVVPVNKLVLLFSTIANHNTKRNKRCKGKRQNTFKKPKNCNLLKEKNKRKQTAAACCAAVTQSSRPQEREGRLAMFVGTNAGASAANPLDPLGTPCPSGPIRKEDVVLKTVVNRSPILT